MSKKARMTIEWRHLELGGITCDRCADTGTNLRNAIEQLRREHLLDNVDLEVKETILPPEQIEESNTVLVNGIPVEEILESSVTFTECSCCSDLIGEPACCC